MTESVDKIVNIRFNYNELIQGWKDVSEAISDTQAYMKAIEECYRDGTMTSEEYTDAHLKQASILKALKTEQRSYEKEIQNNIKAEKSQIGSLSQMRAQVASLTRQYNEMSAEERKSAKGTELIEKLKKERDAIKEAEFAIGDYRSNVGNYENSIKSALGINGTWLGQLAQMSDNAGGASKMLTGMADSMKAVVAQCIKFIATPIGATLAAIYAAYKTVSFVISEYNDAIGTSERLTRKQAEAMSASEAYAQAYTNAMTRSSDAAIEAQSRWANFWAKIKIYAKNFWRGLLTPGSATEAAVNATYAQMQEAEALLPKIEALNAKETEYLKRRREWMVESAQYEKDISEQRLILMDRANQSDTERLAALQTAQKLINARYDKEMELKQLELDIIKGHNELGESTTEQQDQQAQLEADLLRLDTQRNNELRMLARTEATLTKSTITDVTTVKEHVEDLKALYDKLYEEVNKHRATTLLSEQEALKSKYDSEVANVTAQLNEEANISAEKRQVLNAILLQMQENYLIDAQKLYDKYSEQALQKEIQRQEQRIRGKATTDNDMDALLLSQTKAGTYTMPGGANGIQARQALADAELQVAKNKYDRLKAMDEETYTTLYGSELKYQQAVCDAEVKVQEAKAKTNEIAKQTSDVLVQNRIAALGSASKMVDAFTSLVQTIGDDNEALAEFGKALALVNIGVATAEGIARAVASGAGAVWPANLAAIASGISAVLSGIASAYSVLSDTSSVSTSSPKFADGGLVTGEGTSTSDSITAQLSNGEAVMTAKAVSMYAPVLSALNQSAGGRAIGSAMPSTNFFGNQMARSIASAMASMPSPIVTVTDIARAQRRVTVMESTATYKRTSKRG